MKKNSKSTKVWVPEIYYENDSNSELSGNLPFIQVPKEEEMPKFLFIFEARDTGEIEPGPSGEDLPVTDLVLHQYADMDALKKGLNEDEYDRVRSVLGLLSLKEATAKGKKISENIKQKLEG
jgi:hypothetical protein